MDTLHEGGCIHKGAQSEGAQVLAPGDDQATGAGCAGYPLRGGRRVERLPRSDYRGLSPHHGPDLYRAPAAPLARLRHPDRSQAVAAALKAVYRAPTVAIAVQTLDEFGAANESRSIRRSLVPGGTVGAGDSLPCLPARSPARAPHHQRDREPRHAAAEVPQDRGYFPSDEAAYVLLYFVLRNVTRRWTKAACEWKAR